MSGVNPINQKVREGRCYLVSAGDLTVDQIQIGANDMLIAVDGGYLYCKVLQLVPDLVVGDFDSIDDKIRLELSLMEELEPERVVRLTSEKDDTDTLAALRIGLERGYRDFRIYGALGGRLEHTMANIQSLLFLKHNQATGYLMDAETMITVICDESVRFQKDMEGFLSVFSLGDQAEGVTIKGMKYPLHQYLMKNDYPIGVSNEFIGEEGEVSVQKGSLLLIINWG